MTKSEQNLKDAVIAVERAIFELRSGRPVCVVVPEAGRAQGMGCYRVQAAELTHGEVQANAALLTATKEEALLRLLPQWCAALPTFEGENAAAEQHVLTLLKQAELLPAALVTDVSEASAINMAIVPVAAIENYGKGLASQLTEIASASLPIKASEDAVIKVFRSPHGGYEHLALVIGDALNQEAPLVRVHSSCITGDLLGSLRCDCGDQLHIAIEQMAQSGGGVLCYLQQEGRGIGIGNKIRAYELQQQGMDTRQANEALGFAGDERQFALAAAMLKAMGVERVRLMTNNPKKCDELSRYGIALHERVPVLATPTKHNHGYLRAKAERFDHAMGDDV